LASAASRRLIVGRMTVFGAVFVAGFFFVAGGWEDEASVLGTEVLPGNAGTAEFD